MQQTLPAARSALVDFTADGSSITLDPALPVDFGSPAFTIEGWFRIVELPSLSSGPIITQRTGAAGSSLPIFQLAVDFNEPKFTFTSPLTVDSEQTETTTSNFELGTWVHLAVTVDRGNYALYVNGVRSLGASYFHASTQGNPIEIGPTSMDVSDIAIWSEARNDTEVFTDMLAGPPQGPTLVALYDFTRVPPADVKGSYTFVLNSGAQSVYMEPGMKFNQGRLESRPRGGLGLNPGGRKVPFSIEAWIYLDDVSGRNCIFYNQTVGGEAAMTVTDRIFTWQWMSPNYDFKFRATNTPLQPRQWYDLAVTYDGTYLKLYVNGQSRETWLVDNPWTGGDNDYVVMGAAYQNLYPAFMKGYIQFLTVWDRGLHEQEVSDLMYQDPSYKHGLVANFDFTDNPPLDLSKPGSRFWQIQCAIETIKTPTSQTVADRVVPRAAWFGSQGPARAAASTEVATLTEVPADVEPILSEEERSAWRNSVLDALPPHVDEDVVNALLERLEERLDESERLEYAYRSGTVPRRVTRNLVDDHHVFTYNGPDGPVELFRLSDASTDSCTLAVIEFMVTLWTGLISLVFKLDVRPANIRHFVREIVAIESIRSAAVALAGSTFTPKTILDMMKLLYEEGMLRKLFWTCVLSITWLGIVRLIARYLAWIVPGAAQADFFIHVAILATELAIGIRNIGRDCG